MKVKISKGQGPSPTLCPTGVPYQAVLTTSVTQHTSETAKKLSHKLISVTVDSTVFLPLWESLQVNDSNVIEPTVNRQGHIRYFCRYRHLQSPHRNSHFTSENKQKLYYSPVPNAFSDSISINGALTQTRSYHAITKVFLNVVYHIQKYSISKEFSYGSTQVTILAS